MSFPFSFRNRSIRLFWVGVLFGFCSAGCRESQPPTTKVAGNPTEFSQAQATEHPIEHKIKFSDLTEASGVRWICRNGEEAEKYSILETFGAGTAIEDYDRDGKLDLFFGGGGEFGADEEIKSLPIALFRQFAAWKFESVTLSACLRPIRHYHHGMWTADFDEDGFSDLLITGWEGLQLFHNRGDGTFEDVTESAGLNDSLWSVPAAWADLNGDQILDLFVGHYTDWSFRNDPACTDTRTGIRNPCDPTMFKGLPCSVFLGKGDGTFWDASTEIGISKIGKALGVIVADLNDDNRPDIYVANDTLPNQLYVSDSSGQYREAGIEFGVALGETGMSDGSMGVDLGDLDRDGKIDIWVANFENQSFALYHNLGNDLFTHASRPFGVTAVGSLAVGFGTVIFDMDGDGFQDIFCSNGHVWGLKSKVDRRQPPYLFWNQGGKKFVNVAPSAGDYMSGRHLGRGAATADLDGNGTPDLVVTHTNEPVAVLRNDTFIENWLAIRLVGRVSPRSAIGAKITIVTGTTRQLAVVKGGGSYLSTSDHGVLFGNVNQKIVESLTISWPSGRKTVMTNLSTNREFLVIESDN